MPPQELPRHATMLELFADEIDENSYRIASQMTIFMLRSYRYIPANNLSDINIYPVTYFYITLIAHFKYNDDERIIRHVRMLVVEFVKNFKDEFHNKYIEYSAVGDLHEALLCTCAFSMNMCRYIYTHDKHMWYMRATVEVLAYFIGGERFRRDENFASFEEEMGNHWRNLNISLPIVLETYLFRAPNMEP